MICLTSTALYVVLLYLDYIFINLNNSLVYFGIITIVITTINSTKNLPAIDYGAISPYPTVDNVTIIK
jgi:hypothetical protein